MSLTTIPTELLVDIFLLAASHDTPDTKACCIRSLYSVSSTERGPPVNVALSHISHGLRSVACGVPQLWSTLSNRQPREELLLHIERSDSNGEGLEINLHLRELGSSRNCEEFLSAVAPLAHRWEEFNLWASSDHVVDFNFAIPSLTKHCNGLLLPCLTRISLFYPNPKSFFDHWTSADALDRLWFGGLSSSSENFYFFQTWSTPRLKEFKTKWLMPKGPSSSVLTSFEMDLGGPWFHEWEDRMVFSQTPTLYTHTLRRLSLTVGKTWWLNLRRNRNRMQIEFPELETFTFRAEKVNTLQQEIQCLIMPKLESMEVSCESVVEGRLANGGNADLYQWILDLFHPENTFAHLHQLRVVVSAGKQASSRLLTGILERFPNLQHLAVEVPQAVFRVDDDTGLAIYPRTLPALRTVDLRNCLFTDADLRQLVEALKTGARWDALEALCVPDTVYCKWREEHEDGLSVPSMGKITRHCTV